jgi:hypothetical protein
VRPANGPTSMTRRNHSRMVVGMIRIWKCTCARARGEESTQAGIAPAAAASFIVERWLRFMAEIASLFAGPQSDN